MSKRINSSELIPRSRLATIAHRMVVKSESEKQAANMIADDIRKRGKSPSVEMAEVEGTNHWVVIIPASDTNYDSNFEKVAIVPDMSVDRKFKSNHIGIVTPEN